MPTNFKQSVYALAAKIPRGKVSTYSAIARALGKPNAARAVGNALNRNKDLRRVPCYRVVRSDGSLGGYAKGAAKKPAMLRADGIPVHKGKIADFKTYLFKFK